MPITELTEGSWCHFHASQSSLIWVGCAVLSACNICAMLRLARSARTWACGSIKENILPVGVTTYAEIKKIKTKIGFVKKDTSWIGNNRSLSRNAKIELNGDSSVAPNIGINCHSKLKSAWIYFINKKVSEKEKEKKKKKKKKRKKRIKYLHNQWRE